MTLAGGASRTFTRDEFLDWLRIFVAGAVAEKWNAYLSGNGDAHITLRGSDLECIYSYLSAHLTHEAIMRAIQDRI